MEAQALALAGCGVVVGWYLSREAPRDPPPCHCQCGCNVPEGRQNQSWLWVGGVAIILILLALNLVLVLRITVRQNDRGEHEVTLSVKGKSGKGWYGAPHGLQILDQLSIGVGEFVTLSTTDTLEFFHTRLATAHIENDEWLIATPDLDLYLEELNARKRRFFAVLS